MLVAGTSFVYSCMQLFVFVFCIVLQSFLGYVMYFLEHLLTFLYCVGYIVHRLYVQYIYYILKCHLFLICMHTCAVMHNKTVADRLHIIIVPHTYERWAHDCVRVRVSLCRPHADPSPPPPPPPPPPVRDPGPVLSAAPALSPERLSPVSPPHSSPDTAAPAGGRVTQRSRPRPAG